jgi:hypothetical protein
MKTSTSIGVTIAAVALAVGGLLIETWLLATILTWFNVSLTFGQNFTIIVLANLIFKNSGGSSK